jgi:hypothetical protein
MRCRPSQTQPPSFADYGVSERRACKLLAIDRSSYRYEPQPDDSVQLRQDLIELARQKPRFGFRRLGVLLEWRGHTLQQSEPVVVDGFCSRRTLHRPRAADLHVGEQLHAESA